MGRARGKRLASGVKTARKITSRARKAHKRITRPVKPFKYHF